MISMFGALVLMFLLSPGSSCYDTINWAHKQPVIVKLQGDSNHLLVIGFRTFSKSLGPLTTNKIVLKLSHFCLRHFIHSERKGPE